MTAEYNRKTARNRYFSDLIQKNLSNSKKLWKAFNYIVYNKKGNSNDISSIKNAQNDLLNNNFSIANESNNFFPNVGPTLANNLQLTQNRPLI